MRRRSFLLVSFVEQALSALVLDFVGQRNIPTCSKTANVGAVLVFDSEKHPDASSDHLGEGHEERYQARVLDFVGVDGVEDPVKAQDWVDEHGEVVPPDVLVCERVS